MIYLLDTNVWITVLLRPTSSLAERFKGLTVTCHSSTQRENSIS